MSNDSIQTSNGDLTSDETGLAATETVPDDALSTNDVFELLKNSRRREMLYYLNESGGSASLKELARTIASREHDAATTVSDKQYKSVYVALIQTHVPKMEAAGVIDFDEDDQTVVLQGPSLFLYSHLYLESGIRQPPLADVIETSDEVVVRVDLPGFERDDIRIQATDDRLDITATRSSSVAEDETVLLGERSTTVERTVPLPLVAVTEGADARYQGGVLEVTLPKGDTTTVIEVG